MSKEFIEVRRVINDGGKMNMGCRTEILDIDDIKSFREWHKGPNDKYIEGPMVILVLTPNQRVEEVIMKETPLEKRKRQSAESKLWMRTWLIQENFSDFKARIGAKVPVKLLPAE